VRLEGLGKIEKIHLIGTRSRDFSVCNIVPQPTTLPRAPNTNNNNNNNNNNNGASPYDRREGLAVSMGPNWLGFLLEDEGRGQFPKNKIRPVDNVQKAKGHRI
jgi:hypothetical protein